MSLSLSILLASAAMAVAQTTTLDIVFPVEGIKTMYGAVVDANPEVTTFALHCAEHVENVQCHILGTQTVVQGPSTLSIQYYFAGDEEAGYFSEDLACKLDREKGAATCHIDIASEASKGKTVSTSLVTINTELASLMIPAVITEGVDKLENPNTASPASATDVTISSTATSSKMEETSVSEGSSSAAHETPAASSPAVETNDSRAIDVGKYALVGLAATAAAFFLA
ncbi:uncharacterized protein NECHADRAFT_79837 [Fusarium vanettenii 77-13-4]|uniref:Uncharacterized protein n=1 Tax=Fusarium vanettenii (strain ATCC MYA-4622 / CBS 123669 / FGSC 9596 / NRRL 45880 / 77-13-4) TaxID=660122 RepID=C7Z0C0_FUSV7|nr:uncharacterized protein NECHADRAFT_79837 [Fusarium vanettenii 77-13-4]EEU42352.1 hypothetical protein NECHADRAFT_79837 [Fusarium vanettenii 77-13-4]